VNIESFREAVEQVGLVIDAGGVLIIVVGTLLAVGRILVKPSSNLDRYRQFRQDLGRGILLGLEFLVAADIIRTVAVTPTTESVLVLGLIVVIRTFLSFALQLEVEGKLPWQTGEKTSPSAPAS
jgi:Predicted membrane protein